MKKIILLSLTLFWLTAWASTKGPLFNGPAPLAKSEAQVYLYWPASLYAIAEKQAIYIDGHEIGALANGTFLSATLQGGSHELLVEDINATSPRYSAIIKFHAKKGRTYYYALKFEPVATAKKIRTVLIARDPVTALRELKTLYLSGKY